MEWSNEETLLFLELYHSETVLWDPSHEKHKDKKCVVDAWNRIRENEPFNNRTLQELKKKKESLMASFRTHLRKKKASIKSGAGTEDVYKPVWFAYDYMESFLAQIYEVHKSMNTQNQEDVLPDVEDQLPENLEDQETLTNSSEGQSIPLTPARPTQRKSAAATVGSSSQSTNRRRANPPELIEAGKQMQQAFGMLQNVTSKKPLEEDECDLYGKMMAKKLRKIPEGERDMVMYELDGFLLQKTRKIRRLASVFEHPEESLNINPRPTMTSGHVYTSLQSSRASSIDRALSGENSYDTNWDNVDQASNIISEAVRMTFPSCSLNNG